MTSPASRPGLWGVVGVRAADHRQRRPAHRRGPPSASAVAVELDPVFFGRDQRSAAPPPQSDRLPEILGGVEPDELPVVLQLRVRQALVLHQQAIRFRLVSQPDPVREERRARLRDLAEVVFHLRRHHHVRAQLDPAVGVPAEYQVEGRVAPVAREPHLGGRVGNVPFGQRPEEVDRVEQVALADAVVADEAGERPEANVRFPDALEVLDGQADEHRRTGSVAERSGAVGEGFHRDQPMLLSCAGGAVKVEPRAAVRLRPANRTI